MTPWCQRTLVFRQQCEFLMKTREELEELRTGNPQCELLAAAIEAVTKAFAWTVSRLTKHLEADYYDGLRNKLLEIADHDDASAESRVLLRKAADVATKMYVATAFDVHDPAPGPAAGHDPEVREELDRARLAAEALAAGSGA